MDASFDYLKLKNRVLNTSLINKHQSLVERLIFVTTKLQHYF